MTGQVQPPEGRGVGRGAEPPAMWDLNDPDNFQECIDPLNSPLHSLTFSEAVRFRKSELLDSGEDSRKSKISLYADGKLRQAISIEAEHHRESAYQMRYLLYRHGEKIVKHEFDGDFGKINSAFSAIIHSDSDELAADVSNPGKCTLSQCVDARSRPAIQLYITPGSHSEINDISQRLGISMSDFVVICLWGSIITSDAPLPDRLIEHGESLLQEFKRKVTKRLKDLERVRSELS